MVFIARDEKAKALILQAKAEYIALMNAGAFVFEDQPTATHDPIAPTMARGRLQTLIAGIEKGQILTKKQGAEVYQGTIARARHAAKKLKHERAKEILQLIDRLSR
jgi:hypothetical protein